MVGSASFSWELLRGGFVRPARTAGDGLGAMQRVKRAVKVVFGFTLLAIGVVLLITPGPGWVVIFAGLAVLAAEFLWAPRRPPALLSLLPLLILPALRFRHGHPVRR